MATLIYATLTEFKNYIGATTTTEDDTTLTICLTAASRAVDDYCHRSFWIADAATARVYRTDGALHRLAEGDLLVTHDIAATAGVVVETWDGTTYTTADAASYELYPESAIAQSRPATGVLLPSARWCAYRKLRVTARWGWPAVPDQVKQATLIQASRLWTRRDAKGPVMGDPEFGSMRLPMVDPDVRTLIQQLRMPLVA